MPIASNSQRQSAIALFRHRLLSCLRACLPVAWVLIGVSSPAAGSPYFPPLNSRDWARADAAATGWDTTALKAVFDFAEQQGSTGMLIVRNGLIVAERYWPLSAERRQAPDGYAALHHGQTSEGWPLEDVASIQKSVLSVLFGVARRNGLVDLDRPVSDYVGKGWSKAPADREAAITSRHLLAMASGLDNQFRYEAPPGTRWRYNTPVYAQLGQVLERAAGRTMAELSEQWLTRPLGMTDSRWVARKGRFRSANDLAFVTTPRDLARLGLLLLNGGAWAGRGAVVERAWLDLSLAPAQSDFTGYGLLWWLNSGGGDSRSGSAQPDLKGWSVPAAPADMVAARGHFTRRLYIVPSLDLVVVRLGPEALTRQFDQQLWPLLMAALPKGRAAATAAPPTTPTTR